jgi:hypothetical protein
MPCSHSQKEHAPGAAELGKLGEHQVDDCANALVGILLDTIVEGSHVADRHAHEQLAALGLLLHRFLRPLPEAGQLHLADRALHSQQQPVVHLRGIIDAIRIDEQCTHDAAELQQRVPVAAVARQARCFDAQHRADLAIAQHPQ